MFLHISTLKLLPTQPLAIGAYVIVAAIPVPICVDSSSQSVRIVLLGMDKMVET